MTELLITFALVILIGAVALVNLVGRKGRTDLDLTTRQMVTLLREAQSRSMAQASSTAWGVHFENSTSTPVFFALYASTYTQANSRGTYRLPVSVGYATSTLAVGASLNVSFAQITGLSTSTSVTLYLINQPTSSSTIQIASTGAITP